MFVKLSTLALLLPLVSALTINPVTNWQVPGTVTLSFSGSSSDPQTFSVELYNVENFHDQYAVANDITLAQGSVTFVLPQISPGSYSIQLINPSNSSQVYAQYGPFTITAASTTSTPSSTTSSTSDTMSTTPTVSAMTSSTPLMTMSTPAAASGTTSAATTSPTAFNSNGATAFKLAGVTPTVALVLSAMAGAAMVF